MSKRPVVPEDLLRLQFVGEPRISPDGSKVLFTLKTIDAKFKYQTHLWQVGADGQPHQLTQVEGGAGHGRWSPDGTSIAFVSGREKPSSQVFLLPTRGGEARKLTSFPEGTIESFKWAPDGKKLLVRFREQHPDRTESAKKEREEKGLSTPPWVLESVFYRLDGDGYFGGQRFALYVVDVQTGQHRQVFSDDPTGLGDYDWVSDSEAFLVVRPKSDRPFAGFQDDLIMRVDLEGRIEEVPGLPPGPKESVLCSPDGAWIAYMGDDELSDAWGARNAKLYLVPSTGGPVRCLTESDDLCLQAATLSDANDGGGAVAVWSPDSRAIYVNVALHGANHLGYVPIDKGGVHQLTQGNLWLGFGNVSQDGERFGCVFGNATQLNEVGVFDLRRHDEGPTPLTKFNEAWLKEVEVVEPEENWIETPDGTKVHVWVLKPSTLKNGQKAPAILEIHGGPHCQYGWSFFHEFQVLASQGYIVVYSNPRGSKGYGESHCLAIRGDWGNKDWIDVSAVKDWMKTIPEVDVSRIGVMGGSYGGYMTNWAVGHTNDFVAAITDRCVSNMVSMGGSSDFPFVKDGYWKGAPWGDITDLWKQSPIAFFESVETPMLIIHSEGDLRCNVEQGEQVFSALQQRGIESRFVRYPSNTSHGLSRGGPADLRIHRLNEIVWWWQRHLGLGVRPSS